MVLKLIFSQFFCDTDYVKVPDTSKAICQVTLNIILIIIFIIVIVIITILIVVIMILIIMTMIVK